MAISINEVYKEVLNIIKDEDFEKSGGEALSGKYADPRGRKNYITPREFNLFAKRAQEDIFENTLHDYKQAILADDRENAELVKEKLSPFITESADVNKSTGAVGSSPYWIIKVYDIGNSVYYEEVDIDYFNKVKAFASTKAFFPSSSPKHHIYYRKDTSTVVFHPAPEANPDADIVTFPTAPIWAYTASDGVVSHNTGGDTNDFDLHKSERGTLVNKILELAGVSLKDQMLADLALRNESTNVEDKIQ